MKRPALWEVIFSLKAFLAGMLALYIAFSLDLPRPYWALTTAYVVSQPFAASSQSKGLFRFGGTVIGAAMAVALVALFGADDIFMLVGLTAWFCFCGYFALLDRSPRSYFFLLAGMTAVLVGWPGAAGSVFDTGIARVEEIGLGILCTVLVHALILPRPIEPSVTANLEAWAADARRLAVDVLRGEAGASPADRRRIAADASRVGLLAVHLHYDTPEHREMARWIEVLQQRMLMLLPVSASIESRLMAVRAGGEVPNGLDALLERLAGWIEDGAPREATVGLKQAIDEIEPVPSAALDWATMQAIGLVERLRELVSIMGECRDLREHLSAPSQPASRRLLALARRIAVVPHKDSMMAIWSIAGAVLSAAMAELFWYLTGWPQGGGAAQIALLMCLFLGAADDLRPMLRSMILVLCFAIAMDSFYMYVLMPRIQDFPVLVLALAPALLPLGMLGANPATIMIGLMPIAMLTVNETASTDITSFLNGMVATEIGIVIALAVIGVVRSIGVEASTRRILNAGWRDLAAIATAAGPKDRAAFSSRMLDRLGLLAPRLAALPADSSITGADAMADLRLGLDLIELQRRRPGLVGPAASHVAELLDELGDYFHRLRRRGIAPPAERALTQLDQALSAVAALTGFHQQRALLFALSGIRQSLFPEVVPYAPVPAESEPQDAIAARLAGE